MPIFVHSSRMPVPVEALAAWHFRRGALERMLPPWVTVRSVHAFGGVTEGAIAELEMRVLGRRRRWRAVHEEVHPGRGFRDRQVAGPFRAWTHDHRFLPDGEHSLLEDRIDYALPLGGLGALVAGRWVEGELARTFRFRHDRLRGDLRRHAECAGGGLRVAISGATGLVGRNLAAFLASGGHQARRIVRGAADPAEGEIAWDPRRGTIDAAPLEGLDAIVHLAGENIAAGRWTTSRMESIRASRVEGTRLLAGAVARLKSPPKVLVSASAVGFYGDRPDLDGGHALDETGARGTGFLADVAAAWEQATRPAEEAGVRVVHLRIGAVVSAQGGVLAKLLPPFGLGLGGPAGHGRQAMPWISLDDLLGAILWSIRREPLRGAVNAVAPQPRTNREFAKDLAAVLRRPAFMPLPAIAVRTIFGRMGEELLLAGAPVAPRRLLDSGFRFEHPTLRGAIAHELGRSGRLEETAR